MPAFSLGFPVASQIKGPHADPSLQQSLHYIPIPLRVLTYAVNCSYPGELVRASVNSEKQSEPVRALQVTCLFCNLGFHMVPHIDNDVLSEFLSRSEKAGHGYQTMINQALREYLSTEEKRIDESVLRKVIREELKRATQ